MMPTRATELIRLCLSRRGCLVERAAVSARLGPECNEPTRELTVVDQPLLDPQNRQPSSGLDLVANRLGRLIGWNGTFGGGLLRLDISVPLASAAS